MKKKNKKLLLVLSLVIVLVLAFSASALAATNQLTNHFLAGDNSVSSTSYSTTTQSGYSTSTSGSTTYYTRTYHLYVTMPVVAPPKAGYSFTGWKCNWDTTPTYNSGATADLLTNVTLSRTTDTAYTYEELRAMGYIYADTAVFTPQYTANKYTVTLEGDPGDDNYPKTLANRDYESTINLADYTPVRAGYSLLGWRDSSTGLQYAPNAVYQVKGDATLTAIWVKSTDYTVRFVDFQSGILYDYFIKNIDDTFTVPGLMNPPTKAGYTFSNNWSTLNAAKTVTAGNTYTVVGNETFYANFTENDYTITYNGTNCTIVADPAPANAGDTVKLTITPNANTAVDLSSIKVAYGTHIVAVTNATTAANGVVTAYFNMPAANVEVTATAETNVFAIHQTATNCTISVLQASTGTGTVDNGVAGNQVQFTVTPAPNTSTTAGVFSIGNVTITAGGTTFYPVPIAVDPATNAVTYTFTMPKSAVTITANASLQADQHTIYFLKYDNTLLRKVTVSDASTYGPAANGLIPQTRTGYTFSGWYVTQINAAGAQEYGDQFADAAGVSNYSIKSDLVVKQYYEGAALRIVSGTDAATMENTVDILSVTSEYTKADNTITNNTGNLRLTGGFCATQSGANVNFTVKSKPNYKITNVAVAPSTDGSTTVIPIYRIGYDAANDEYTYSFTMPAENVKIIVNTEPLPYTVSVTENPAELADGGTYTINGYTTDNKEVKQGQTATVNVKLVPGYRIANVTASYLINNGAATAYCNATNIAGSPVLNTYVPNATQTSFSFIMPQADVNFAIVYEKINYNIDTTTSNNASLNNIGAVDALEKQGYVLATNGAVTNTATSDLLGQVGDEIRLDVTAQTGYKLKDIAVATVGGKAVSLTTVTNGKQYKFNMPAEAVVVTATFEKLTYEVNFVDYKDTPTNPKQNIAYLGTPTIPTQDPVREGYDFLGWASADVRVPVTDAAPSKNAADFVIVKDTVIKAVYEKHNYNIEYGTLDANGNYVNQAPVHGTADAGYTNGYKDTNPSNANYGDTVSFDVKPAVGYQIKEVKVYYYNSKNVKQEIIPDPKPNKVTGGTYSFVMPNADLVKDTITIGVTYEEISYDLTTVVNQESQGTVYVNGSDDRTLDYVFGKTINVTIKPNEGWILQSLTVVTAGGVTVNYTPVAINPDGGMYTFKMPSDNATVTVNFAVDTYSITYNTPVNGLNDVDYTNGYANINPVSADNGAEVTFNAKPREGYQIKSAEVSYIENKEDGTTSEKTIAFKKTPNDLKVGGDYVFTMPNANVRVKVLFEEQTYKAGLTVVGDGSANLQAQQTTNSTSVNAKFEEVVTIVATPDPGYELTGITVNEVNGTQDAVAYTPVLNKVGGTYRFEMPADDVAIVVTFTAKAYNITYDVGANGTVAPKDDLVAHGSNANFTVTPNEGYEIDSVTASNKDKAGVTKNINFDKEPKGDELKVGGVYTFVMPETDVAVKVTFKEQTYNVDLTIDGQAKVLLKNTDQVKATALYKETVVVNVTPEKGWELKAVTAVKKGTTTTVAVTPTAINTNGGNYSIVMPSSDVSISVKLAKKNSDIASYAISFTGDPHGTISVPIGATADYGDTVNVISDPDDGYRFKAISVKAADGSYIPVSFVGQTAGYITTHSFTMPDSAVEIYVTFEQHSASRYTDVRDDDWYYEATEFVSDRGYFVGTAATLFEPNKNMTRAMFVKVLSRLAGVDTTTFTTSSFTDVAVSEWYGPAVEWASKQGIIKGYGNGLFGPNDEITREQMAQIMYNFCKWSGYDVSVKNPTWVKNFSDYNQISAYALPAVTWAVSSGMMHGDSPSILRPLGTATRAEVAQVIKNLCDKVIYE